MTVTGKSRWTVNLGLGVNTILSTIKTIMGEGKARHYLPKGSILFGLGRQGLGSNGWCLTSQGTNPCVLWVTLDTVTIKAFLFFYVHKIGKETQNPIVKALAYDHRNDIWSASATSVGIFLSQRGVSLGRSVGKYVGGFAHPLYRDFHFTRIIFSVLYRQEVNLFQLG